MATLLPYSNNSKKSNFSFSLLAVYYLLLVLTYTPLTIRTGSISAKSQETSVKKKSLVNRVRNYKLKELFLKGKKNGLSHQEILSGILLSLYESENIVPNLLAFFLSKKKKKITAQQADYIIKSAIEANNSTAVNYLLENKICDPKMLSGTTSYSTYEFFSTMASRTIGSITMQPRWKKRIWGKIFRFEFAILSFLITMIPFLQKLPYISKLRRFLIIIGTVNTFINFSLAFRNVLIILYSKGKIYRPGYLFMVLQQKRYTADSTRIFKLLVKYGANPSQKAYFFYPKKETAFLPALFRLYRIEHIAPFHLAIRNNNIEIVKWLLSYNKKLVYEKAYIITDKTPPNITPFVETVTLQAIYSKQGDEKEKPCIQSLLPTQLCLKGTPMERLLLKYEKKRKSKSPQSNSS